LSPPALAEAAARNGEAASADEATKRLSQRTRAAGTDWALGIETRTRALISDDMVVESLYREAIVASDVLGWRFSWRGRTSCTGNGYGETVVGSMHAS